MSPTNRATTQARDAQVIEGIKKDLQNASSLPLAGTTYTPAALMQLVQSRIDMANAVANAKANWHDAVAKYRALNAHVAQVVRGLRSYVLNAYGESSPVLADFGFTPPKKATLTSEARVAKALKAAATRKARGTTGKKAKKAVKGSVQITVTATPTKVVPVPVATPPEAGSAAPAGGAAPTAGPTAPGGSPSGAGSGAAHS
jgi:hypothetical protein